MPAKSKSITENMNGCGKKGSLKKLNVKGKGGKLKHR